VIAGDNLSADDFRDAPNVTLIRLRQEPGPEANYTDKAWGILSYYSRLIRYAWMARPTLFHILWNNKFEVIDRVFLMLFYRSLGKKVVLTLHNVNAGTRDVSDSWLNRTTLGIQYRLADHIFVHTAKMKAELVGPFRIPSDNVTVIPFGINNAAPQTSLTTSDAKRRVGVTADQKTILFFGNIAPYKGLEYLIEAFCRASSDHPDYRLVIAGRTKRGFESYWESIQASLSDEVRTSIISRIEFIPEEDTEVYFKAADVLVLPYTSIFQSGVLFLAYSFGLPVLVADVGSLKEDVEEGETGFSFAPRDASAIARALDSYFSSELFRDLPARRSGIRERASAKYSWSVVADMTRAVYETLTSDESSTTARTSQQARKPN
jgi:glycosyltransferase involved in cell wall biosynthesis